MFNKTMMEMKFRIIIFGLFFVLMLVVLIVTRPVIDEVMSQMSIDNEQLKDLPEFFKNMLAETAQISKMLEDDQFFLLSQWYSKNFGQFLPLFALIMTFTIFSREADKGTIYFLLAKKNRSALFWGKTLTGYFVVITMVLLFSFLAPIAMMLSGYAVTFTPELFAIIIQQVIGVTFFYALFILFSILFNDQIKPVLAGIIVIVGLPFLSMFESLKWLNPYPYILGTQVISKGTFDGIYSLSLVITTAVITYLGLELFKKKEY
ncbi:MAG: ABC transporter permease subunit [Thermotogota bacterium]